MTEGVTEVERGSHTGLFFVGTDHRSLGRAGTFDGVSQGLLIQLAQPIDIVFEPGQKRLIADQPVLDDFTPGRQTVRGPAGY